MTTETPVRPPTELPRRRTDDILTTLADRIGGRFTASTVFGSPVEREGVTVIPVATVRFGLAGGGGEDPNGGQSGEGGGGAGSGTPAGYIEIKDGRSRFVPARAPDADGGHVLRDGRCDGAQRPPRAGAAPAGSLAPMSSQRGRAAQA